MAEGKIDLAEKQEALRLVSRENERAEEMLERTQKENVKLQESLNGTKAQIAHMTFEYKEWKMKFEDDKSKATKELDALSEATKKRRGWRYFNVISMLLLLLYCPGCVSILIFQQLPMIKLDIATYQT